MTTIKVESELARTIVLLAKAKQLNAGQIVEMAINQMFADELEAIEILKQSRDDSPMMGEA